MGVSLLGDFYGGFLYGSLGCFVGCLGLWGGCFDRLLKAMTMFNWSSGWIWTFEKTLSLKLYKIYRS